MNTRSITLAIALSAGLWSSTAEAQTGLCFGPDGLNSTACCAPVGLDIPDLIPFDLQSSGFCWEACDVVDQNCLGIIAGPGVPTAQCGQFVRDLEVVECTGLSLMKGELVLDYTRTWEERLQPGAPPQYQVWRFAAKIDLTGDFTATPQCPVPPSLVPTIPGVDPTTFFYGYYDLALDCTTNTFEHALVLFNACDAFQHAPGLSSTPGVFNPTSTYAIVGPDNAANPFVPNAFPTPGNFVVGEALRRAEPNFPGLCTAEEMITQGIFQPLGSACLCPLTAGSVQQTASVVDLAGMCGSGAQSINAFPAVPWIHFITTSIGGWTTGAAYPGPERVAVGEGAFLYRDACSPTGFPEQSLDIFYGGLTFGGFFTPGSITPVGTTQAFVDLASNYSALLPGPIPFPLVGNVRPTKHLMYFNY
ncbi:MAG: hypothetical protein AAFZ65_10300 [Planctomycetota bacterium]